MSYWGLIFVLLATVMIVGPIMLMKPSVGQQKISDLRQAAAEIGLKIRLDTYISSNQTQSVAVYSLFDDLLGDAGSWLLWRKNYAHGIHFHNDWEWRSTDSEHSTELSSGQLELIHQWLEELPKEIVGVEVNNKQVGLWWKEQGARCSLADIHSALKKLLTFLITP